MTTRRHITLTDKLRVMVRQAICPRCGEKLGSLDNLQWDHQTPLAMGGVDDESNLVAIHVACHSRKTIGTPATTAGSDIQVIAKSKRLSSDTEEFRRRLLAKAGQGEMPERKASKWRFGR